MRARGPAQPPVRQDRRPADRRGSGGRPDRPQCFDISLWQLVSGLVVGGRTLLIEQEVVLDVERFVDKVVDGRVAVLQVVPSYLEAVVTYLEQHPRELPNLRCVSVTGEALKKELAQRWFATVPGSRLVNAYGLTETSDDTNHEVMDRVPTATGSRSALRSPTCACMSSTSTCSRCRSAPRARSSSPGSVSAGGTSTTPSAPAWPSCPTRTARASGSTAAATTGAGCRTASWSSSADGTRRSRSPVSASRSARSRTPCCACPVCATARWSWRRGRPEQAPGRASTPVHDSWR